MTCPSNLSSQETELCSPKPNAVSFLPTTFTVLLLRQDAKALLAPELVNTKMALVESHDVLNAQIMGNCYQSRVRKVHGKIMVLRHQTLCQGKAFDAGRNKGDGPCQNKIQGRRLGGEREIKKVKDFRQHGLRAQNISPVIL